MAFQTDAGDFAAWLEGFAARIDHVMDRRMAQHVGPRFKAVAGNVTRAEDARASGHYYDNFRHEPYQPPEATAGRALVNDSWYTEWVEFGRPPGGFPPEAAILKWMERRSIPEEALFPIRRAIARHGTVKRKEYGGFQIFQQVYERMDEEVFAILDAAFVEELRRG